MIIEIYLGWRLKTGDLKLGNKGMAVCFKTSYKDFFTAG